MSRIYKKITDLIGGTPLLELSNYERENKLKATILAKLEYFNPAGSVKDRIAKAMIDDAEEKGLLKKKFGYYRTYFRKYGNWARFCRRVEKI